jgi:hypothetical protein
MLGSEAMSCDDFNKLDKRLRQAKEHYAQFAYPQNAHLRWGMSDRQVSVERNKAEREVEELSTKISQHALNCERCKKN